MPRSPSLKEGGGKNGRESRAALQLRMRAWIAVDEIVDPTVRRRWD